MFSMIGEISQEGNLLPVIGEISQEGNLVTDMESMVDERQSGDQRSFRVVGIAAL